MASEKARQAMNGRGVDLGNCRRRRGRLFGEGEQMKWTSSDGYSPGEWELRQVAGGGECRNGRSFRSSVRMIGELPNSSEDPGASRSIAQ